MSSLDRGTTRNGDPVPAQSRFASEPMAGIVGAARTKEDGTHGCPSDTASTEDFPKTPEACNTGVSTRHSQPANHLTTGGIDTLEVSLYGMFSPSDWNALRPQLEAARKRAESGLDDSCYIKTAEGDRLEVAAHGISGAGCRYLLEWNGCTIGIVDNPAPSDKRLSVRVVFGSVYLTDVGHQAAWDSVMSLLASIGYQHIREVIGRVDLCVDLPGQSMADVQASFHQRQFIARARKGSMFFDLGDMDVETLNIGRGQTTCRLYNKLYETRNDPVKRNLLIERRWGQEVDQAIRVEFQLRRTALKRRFQVTTFSDLLQSLGSIAQWLTTDWLRFVGDFDRGNRNHSRADVSPWWVAVQEAFTSWTGEPALPCPPIRRLKPDLSQLKKQAVGCAATVFAHVEDGVDFMANWIQLGKEAIAEAPDIVINRRHKLAALARVVHVPEAAIPF